MTPKLRYETGETRALKTYVKLMRAAESITTRVHKHLSSAGLTVSQFGVLEAIYHLGPLSQKDLGRKILRSSGNITMVIDNLEKRRLVRRERDSSDRRIFIVHLTGEGQKLICKIFPSHAALITDELRVLDAKDQMMLGNLCKKVGMGVNARN
ncbi:MAG: MarR family transcriptional regulator [Desulfobacteraceae bacterium]|jgi:MarR family 2-MHQ and catechol resistance regulon transcriptional repressor|nr:MarR family transcriptional regulator [Desulfobacteraceae bacterium]